MSTLTQFTVTGKEKDEFYGFHIAGVSNQVINKVVTKDIVGENKNDSVYEYALATPYDASTISLTTTTSLVRRGSENTNQSGTSDMHGVAFNPAGTIMISADKENGRIVQYALSTGFDVGTLTWTKELDVKGQDLSPNAVTFNNDGSKMYMLGLGGPEDASVLGANINEYALSSNYDIATATYTDRFSVRTEDTNPQDLYFNNVARGAVNAGGLCFVVGDDGNDVNEYLLGTEYDISTAAFVDAFSIAAEESDPRALLFDNDGDKLFVMGNTGNDINQYPLVTGFDISTTQSITHNTSLRTNNIVPRGMAFNADGSKLFVIGVGGTLVIDGGDDELPITHVTRARNDIKFYEGNTYVFDVSDSNLTDSDFKFSTTSGGTKEGGSEYTTNVTTSGTIGQGGATVTIQIPKKGVSTEPGSAIDTLYYYESNFTNTGGKIYTPEWKGELQITKTNGADNIETRFETKEQEDIFKNSFFMRAGLNFTVDDGDLKVELN
tara:strand:+ start:214 stop:1695 length:1482 start_codon:yes stop_codon:yes gene_type:complete